MNNFPKSVSQKIIDLNPQLWTINKDLQINDSKINIISGSSFIDKNEPNGELGNPFTVVIGDPVANLTTEQRIKIAHYTNTPETV